MEQLKCLIALLLAPTWTQLEHSKKFFFLIQNENYFLSRDYRVVAQVKLQLIWKFRSLIGGIMRPWAM